MAAQTTINGSLRGRISDPSGAALPRARVTLTDEETGAQFSASSDGDWQYLFARVAPGEH